MRTVQACFLENTKMAPKLSPKKSVEGGIGGIVGAALLCAILCSCKEIRLGAGVNPAQYAVICGVGGMISQIGDLAAFQRSNVIMISKITGN